MLKRVGAPTINTFETNYCMCIYEKVQSTLFVGVHVSPFVNASVINV